MKRAVITEFDIELVDKSRVFLEAAEANPDSRALLEQFGYSKEEHDRGVRLVREAGRSFEWEKAGTAWNFLTRLVQGHPPPLHARMLPARGTSGGVVKWGRVGLARLEEADVRHREGAS
jgi:hypothetical protein